MAPRMRHIGHLPRCDCHNLKTLSDMARLTCAVAYCARGLTFELRGRQRQDARPEPQKMYTVPVARAWWPAVGAQLERGVRPHSARVARECLVPSHEPGAGLEHSGPCCSKVH